MTLKPANACKREKILSEYKCSYTRMEKCRLVSPSEHNKHYSLHKKICTQCAYGASQGEEGEDLSRETTRPAIGKVSN